MSLKSHIHHTFIKPDIWLDSDSKHKIFQETIPYTESLPTLGVTKNLSEVVSLTEDITVSLSYFRAFADTVSLGEDVEQYRQYSYTYADGVTLSDSVTQNLAKVTSYSDAMGVSDTAPNIGTVNALLNASTFNTVPLN